MVTGFAYQALSMILNFVSRTVFIYMLGTEYLGLNGIFSDVLSLLSMADLGFSTAMAYSFYQPLADGDEDKITSLIHFYKKIYNTIAAAVCVLGLACIPFLKYIVNTEQDIPNLTVYYLFALAGVVISYMFVYKTTLLTADQKNYKLVQIYMWTTMLRVVLQIAALALFHNYILYLAVSVGIQLLSNLVASNKTEREYPYIKKPCSGKLIESDLKKNIVSNMKSVFIYKLSGTLFTATDNIIISMVVSTAAVGLYSNYLMISNKLLLIEQIVFSALTASVGSVIASESAKKRLQIFEAMQSASFIFCGIITSVFCLIVNDAIKVWLGEPYMLTTLTVLAVSLNTYLSCVLQPLWIYRDASGLYVKTKYIMLIGALLNIVLSVIMGEWIGVAGVIFASAISRLSTYFWYEPKLLFREYFGESVKGYYLQLLKNLSFVILTVAILYGLLQRLEVVNLYTLILKAAIVGIVCSAVFMLLYMKSDGFQIILNKVKDILKRNNIGSAYVD